MNELGFQYNNEKYSPVETKKNNETEKPRALLL